MNYTKQVFIILLLLCSTILVTEISHAASSTPQIIGKWQDTSLRSNPIYIIVKNTDGPQKDNFTLYSSSKDSAKILDTLKFQGGKYLSITHTDLGEYYIINKSNELEIYDRSGLIRKCGAYKGKDYSLVVPQNPASLANIISFTATPLGEYIVKIDIEADFPDGAMLSASIGKHGQKPSDIYIGTDFVKVPLISKVGSLQIDVLEKATSASKGRIIPGDYDVSVSFHPKWVENRQIAANLKIVDTIEAMKLVSLGVSGESLKSNGDVSLEGRQWVIANVNMGMKWDRKFWENKFGIPEIYKPDKGNEHITDVYYFPTINMAIIVNTFKNEIITWRDGKANH